MEDLLQKARSIAMDALRDDTRYDGTPFLGHADAVAAIIRYEIGLPRECEVAVYLHEALRAHPDTEVDGFPQDIMTITEGLNKISTIKPKDTRLEAERYKKLIMAYSTDPRVTVIKIADRLEVMRHLQMFPKVSRDQKLLETLLLYIPLAHQLGLYNIKSEMEDIYFRFAEPEQHRQITRKLKAGEKGREQLVREFIHPLEQKLAAEGIRYKLKTRTKTAYSIYKKMLKQNVPFEGVFDVFAIRFIIKCDGDRKQEADLCWKVYSYVTEEYEADTERLRDWITQPKDNGYESLHITVKNKSGNFLEVQIRTERMDDIAENGLASHWSYKGIKGDATLDSWLKSVRYHLEHPLEASSRDEIIQPSDKEIFVFTPTGELRILPAGSSVLDFAFNIHTGLGCHCTGARIGGRTVPIKEKLSTGDVVEILSNKNQRPSQDWLNWVISSKARSKIKLELDADLRRSAAEGRELLERRLKNWKMALPDELLAEMMHYLKYSSVINFMADVGYGKIDVNDIKAWILDPSVLVQRATPPTPEKKTDEGGAPKDNEILVINARGVKGLEYKMAPCCHPVYGDKVFGFVTRSEGIKIHREDCPNAPRLKAMYPYRVQKVVWAEKPVAQNLSLKPGKK